MTCRELDNKNVARMLVGQTVGDAIDTSLTPYTIELRDQLNDDVGRVDRSCFQSDYEETISLAEIREVEILECLYYVHNEEKCLILFIEI